MLEVIKTTSPEILTEKLILRYVKMCDRIRRGVSNAYTLNREYSYLMDMMLSFLVLSFYKGVSQPEIENQAHLAVLNRIV